MSRFKVEKVELLHESEGPDYFTMGEFRVTDLRTGEIVASFPWSLEEAYLTNANYSGPDEVRISDDDTEAIAHRGSEEQRVLLPDGAKTISFDGVVIAPDTDFAELVARIAADDGPPHPDTQFREPGGQWLWKLYQRLGRTPQTDALAAAIAGLLSHDDARRRAASLQFYVFRPEAAGGDRMLDLAERQRDLFGGAVEAKFIDALAARIRSDAASERVLALARREALSPGVREPLLVTMANHDAVWVREHALAIARSDTHRWKELLYAIYVNDSDSVGAMASRLVDEGVATARDVRQFAESKFFSYGLAEVQRVLAGRD